MKQLVVASEYGEPSKYEDVICQRLSKRKDICLLLITKNLPKCLNILEVVKHLEIPLQIHCTITGLGNTPMEPHIPLPDYILEQSIKTIIEYGINPKAVTIRIDPIVPEFLDKQMNTIPRILDSFSKIGVKDCRVSIIDYYPHVRARFDSAGVNHPNRFQTDSPTKERLIRLIASLTVPLGIDLHLCAEEFSNSLEGYIDTEGCASAASWERLGIDSLKPSTRKQRKECTCDLKKEDLLAGLSKGCKGGCIYCYWRS